MYHEQYSNDDTMYDCCLLVGTAVSQSVGESNQVSGKQYISVVVTTLGTF